MKHLLLFVGVISSIFFINYAYCSNGDNILDNDLGKLTIVNLGAVVVNPEQTKIVITDDGRLLYKRFQIDPAKSRIVKIVEKWNVRLLNNDFLDIINSIISADLVNQKDIVERANGQPCLGSNGIRVSFISSLGKQNNFLISGDSGYRCGDKTAISQELDSLLSLINDLVSKYKNNYISTTNTISAILQ